MPDVFTAVARRIFDEAVSDMRGAVEGLTPKLLNQRPARDDTNSIAVLAVHSLHSTRSWLSVATGAPLPERNRDDEFVASVPDAGSLLAFVDQMAAHCRALLASAQVTDWAEEARTHTRPEPDAEERVPRAFALMHALSHLREHTGQMMLTRQVLEAKSG